MLKLGILIQKDLPRYLKRNLLIGLRPLFLNNSKCAYSTNSPDQTRIPVVNIPVLHKILQFHDRIALADQRGEHTYSQLFLRR